MTSILSATLAEWGTFFSGMAAMLVLAVPLIVKIIERRNKAHLKEAFNSFMFDRLRETLTTAAERAGPHRTRVIDIKFLNPAVLIRLPVVMGEWLTVLPGCEIMGDQFSETSTVYFLKCENTARIRRHTHDGAESVLVVRGTMKDLMTGTVYTAGMTWDIPAGIVHSVHFEAPEDNSAQGLFIISVTPPLPTPAQVLLQLDGLMSLAG